MSNLTEKQKFIQAAFNKVVLSDRFFRSSETVRFTVQGKRIWFMTKIVTIDLLTSDYQEGFAINLAVLSLSRGRVTLDEHYIEAEEPPYFTCPPGWLDVAGIGISEKWRSKVRESWSKKRLSVKTGDIVTTKISQYPVQLIRVEGNHWVGKTPEGFLRIRKDAITGVVS